MAREGLLYALRTGLHQARTSERPVRKEGLRVRYNGEEAQVAVEIVPLGGAAAESRHYLVLLQETRPAAKVETAPPPPADAAESAQVTELQVELAGTRSYLQAMIQDLEAANEELQSANEEVLSSNEELQSTNEELDTAKEELQSTNEELHTLNEELQGRNEELGRLNSDLVNLLGSMQTAVVMVDNDLRIRRFTPTAEKVLNLIPGDVGRPIGQIKPNIDCPELEQLIRRAIAEVTTVEREVRGREQGWYHLRIRSYKDHDNRIDGAVLSLLDIERLKAYEREAALARQLAEEVLQTVGTPLALVGGEGRLRALNHAFAGLLGLSTSEAVGRPLDELVPEEWDGPQLRELLAKRPRRRGGRQIAIPTDGDGGRTRRLSVRRVEAADDYLLLLTVLE